MKVDIHKQHEMLLRSMVNRFEGEFGEHFTRQTIEHYIRDSYAELVARSTVLVHVPAFVDRYAKQRLRSIAKNRGLITDLPPVVLFVCGRNDGLSQMASSMFSAEVGDRAVALSAGARPADLLLDEAVEVMAEIGIDMLGEFPKPVTPEVEEAADVIVTIDAHDEVDLFDDREYLAWHVSDRRDEGIDGFRAMRDELRAHVLDLVHEVVPPAH